MPLTKAHRLRIKYLREKHPIPADFTAVTGIPWKERFKVPTEELYFKVYNIYRKETYREAREVGKFTVIQARNRRSFDPGEFEIEMGKRERFINAYAKGHEVDKPEAERQIIHRAREYEKGKVPTEYLPAYPETVILPAYPETV